MSTNTVGSVAEVRRFPVKSMQGEILDAVEVVDGHVAGDRGWAVVDAERPFVLSAKRVPALLFGGAHLDDATGTVTIDLPDGAGTGLVAGDPATDAAISAWLDRPVALRRATGDEPLPYELHVDATDDTSETWAFPGPPGRWVDLAAAHLLTTASLAAAGALLGADIDVRRFRPTLLVATDPTAGPCFVEDDWVGTTVGLGGAVRLSPFMRAPRCSMTARAQPGLERNADVPRTLARDHGNDLGIYCGVEADGRVAVGDPVTVTT